MRALSAILLTLTAPAIASAHPGHGSPEREGTVLHYLSEPVHLACGFGAVMTVAIFWRIGRSLRKAPAHARVLSRRSPSE